MPQNCFLVYSTALKAMVEEMRKIHNWLSDHVQKEQTMQGRLIYSLIVIDLRRELSDFEKRAEAFEEAGNKNKSADQETVEYINRTANVIHAALREWKSEHQPDEDFDVVIDKHSMGSFLKVLKRLNEMNDVEEKKKLQKVLVNGMAGEDMVEKSVEPEAKNGEKPQPKNGKAKHNGKRKQNGKKEQHEQPQEPEQNSAHIEQPEPELAQQEPVQTAPAEPEPEQQREEQPEQPQQATPLEPQNAQKAQPKNGKRKQNGKRKRNGQQEQDRQQQNPPQEPKQNHSAHIEQPEPELAQQEPDETAPAETKLEQQREEQPEQPQQATSLESQNAQKAQPKNGKRKQNGKRKRNGHQEQNGQHQEQPHEPEQNHSAHIDQQESHVQQMSLQTPPGELEQSQATPSLKSSDSTVPAI